MAIPHKFKKVTLAALAALGATAGAAGIASAATSQPAPTDPPTTAQQPAGGQGAEQSGEQDESPSYQGSITVPQTPDDGTDDETAEAAKLKPLAKITADDATKAATAAVPGTAGQVQLGDENGNVVYEVEVTAANGSKVEVKVDAGNGDVLAQEADDQESNDQEGNEANEAHEAPEISTEAPAATPAN